MLYGVTVQVITYLAQFVEFAGRIITRKWHKSQMMNAIIDILFYSNSGYVKINRYFAVMNHPPPATAEEKDNIEPLIDGVQYSK